MRDEISAIVMVLITGLIFGFGFGQAVGKSQGKRETKSEIQASAIKAGVAQFNPTNAVFEWKIDWTYQQ